MSLACERCGVGRRDVSGTCDWCAAPARARLPFWIVFRRRLLQSAIAVNARRRGAVATGMAIGVVLHLLVAAVGVAFGLPLLWQAGFLWSQQWWWSLAPEAWQPWLFAAVCGVAYGGLAGWVAATARGRGGEGARGGRGDGVTGRRGDGETDNIKDEFVCAGASVGTPRRPLAPSPPRPLAPSPATVTALVAFVVAGWEPVVGTQYQLVAAALGAAVGRLTTLMLRGGAAPVDRRRSDTSLSAQRPR